MNLLLLQGVTMKPFVTWLKVKRAAVAEVTLIEKVQNKVELKIKQQQETICTRVQSNYYRISVLVFQVFEHSLVAIEDISGQIGDNYLRGKYVKTSLKPLAILDPF